MLYLCENIKGLHLNQHQIENKYECIVLDPEK